MRKILNSLIQDKRQQEQSDEPVIKDERDPLHLLVWSGCYAFCSGIK
jgi:hypothetical protein